MRVIFVDVATTGLDPSQDRIVAYSFIAWEDDRIIARVDDLVDPCCEVSPQARRVNGYNEQTWQELGAKPFSEKDIEQVAPFVEGSPVYGGSNPGFDIAFLKAEFNRIGYSFPTPAPHTVDLMTLALPLKALGDLHSAGLMGLATFFGLHTELTAESPLSENDLAVKVWRKLLLLYALGSRHL